MTEILAHLLGDYVLQSDWMARGKTGRWLPALAHATVYTLCFVLWGYWQPVALLVMWATHLLIDHYRLARFVVFANNRMLGNSRAPWPECSGTGYHKDSPPWLAVWLLIIVDNTLHLTINHLALRFLP